MRPDKINIPEDWNLSLLDKVATRGSGHTPDKKQATYWNGGIKWVSLADSSKLDNVFISNTDKEISSLGIQNSSAVLHKKGTVLLSRDAGVGKSAIMAEDMAVSQHFIAWECTEKNKLDNMYLYYWLQMLKPEFERIAIGSTIKTIGLPYFKKFKLPHPSLAEQSEISRAIYTWDIAIQKLSLLIEKKTNSKKGLMQNLLSGKQRISGYSNEWQKLRIKDVAVCLDNKRKPLNSTERAKMKGDIPYWGANNVMDYVNDFLFDETIVLLAEDGGYFDQYQNRPIANISHGKCWVNNHAHILKAKNNSINEWIYYSLVHKNILAFINGGTRAKLNKSDMMKIPVLLPEKKEQEAICSILSHADREIVLLKNKLLVLKSQKRGVMQQLLTGKKRLKSN